MLALSYITKKVEFDPHDRLLLESMDSNFDIKTSKTFKQANIKISKSAIHLHSGACICEFLAEKKVDKTISALKQIGYENRFVNITNLPKKFALISTPSIVIFDEDEKLLYLGSYNSGLECVTESDVKISSILAPLPGAFINVDSTGCYCQNKV